MFGPLGFQEVLFIVVLALLIFGPKKLPEVGRTIGKGMAQFRKASNDLKRTLDTELLLEERRENPPRPVRPLAPPTHGAPLEKSAGEAPGGEPKPETDADGPAS